MLNLNLHLKIKAASRTSSFIGMVLNTVCRPPFYMKYNTEDLIGKRFGRWLVLRRSDKKPYVDCVCDCGKEKSVKQYQLLDGGSRSCGCLHKEMMSRDHTLHGMSNTKEYKIWACIKQRCLNKNSRSYKAYGGRGIKMCDRWLNSFENFLSDMGMKPRLRSVERIDNNGDYSPENCRWETYKNQGRNTRKNRNITHNGETLCLAAWAEKSGIHVITLRYRIFVAKWSMEDALNARPNTMYHLVNKYKCQP